VDKPPAVAFTAFADTWPRARETEIGAALCAIGAGRTLVLKYFVCSSLCSGMRRAAKNFKIVVAVYICLDWQTCPNNVDIAPIEK